MFYIFVLSVFGDLWLSAVAVILVQTLEKLRDTEKSMFVHVPDFWGFMFLLY